MKNLFKHLRITALSVILSVLFFDTIAQSVSATYTSGDISTRRYEYEGDCNGPTNPLTVTLPGGGPWKVTSIDIAYDIKAQGNGWMSEQRSLIHFQNHGINENGGIYYSGVGDATGIYSYSRTNVDIANGVYNGGENLVFEMRAWRTYDGGSDCGTSINRIDNNTWIVTVYYVADNTNTTIVSQTSPSCVGGNDAAVTITSVAGASEYSYVWSDAVSSNISPVNRVASTTGLTIFATGNNRMLVVAVATRKTTLQESTISYGGQSLTLLTELNTLGGNKDVMIEYFYLNEVGISAAANITITGGCYDCSDIYVHSMMFENVDQDNPFGLITGNTEFNSNDDDISLPSQDFNPNEYSLIAVANGEDKSTSANNGATSGYTEYTDETGGGLGLSLQGLGYSSSTTKATADVDLSGNVESKVVLALVLHPDASTINGLAAGVYAVTTTYGNVETDITNITITDPTPVLVTLTATDYNGFEVTCNGASDGVITASTTGGNGISGYTYLWDVSAGSQTTNPATGLSAGSYTVTATDGNGCVGAQTLVLTEPTVLTASAIVGSNYNGEDVSCEGAADGQVDASAGGGTPTYSYQWNSTALSSTNASVLGLPAGIGYVVTITDLNGCTASSGVTITEPTAVSISTAINSSVTCNGGNDGQITATGTGGTGSISYSWSANTGVQSSSSGIGTALLAGTYTVTASDDNGCAIGSSPADVISEPATISISLSSQTNVSCNAGNDGAIDINVAGGIGGYTYNWTGGATTQDINTLTLGA
ncbi:MAG: SprB repeat-containing protein, partial [Flavobacteriales bacterium]|nr:SprB repeat-containing protein [Flavobacteriales bacterium]